MRSILFTFLALLIAVPGLAQTPSVTGYEVRYYNPGATSPFQAQPIPAASTVCSATDPAPSGSSVNPDKVVWEDPNRGGQFCMYQAQAGDPLVAFPVGAYEATLVAISDAGTSAESNRAPFSRADAPSVPTGLRIVR